jgi:hypothetical protein
MKNAKMSAELLLQATIEFETDERFIEFFRYNTLGVPLAYFVTQNAVTGLTATGENILNDTWVDFCRILKVDPELEWQSLEEMQLGFMFGDDDDEDSE